MLRTSTLFQFSRAGKWKRGER